MATRRKNLTYRIRQIPTSISQHHALVSRLISVKPELGPYENIKVLSLAPFFDSHEKANAMIATVTFRQLPALFEEDRPSWELPTDSIGSSTNLLIDNKFLGFTPLNNVSSDAHLLDCIAISGLASHPFGSWKCPDEQSNHMWLRDRLPQDFPQVRSVIYGYNTELLKSRSIQTADDIAKSLNHMLRATRRVSKSAKPIMFLAHSLGGIILKKALTLLATSGSAGDRAIVKSIRQILLFGVPNRGMHISHLMPMVEGQPNKNLIELLKPNSADLERLDAQFNDIIAGTNTRVISIYELKQSPTTIQLQDGRWSREGPLALLVDVDSATHAASAPHDVVPVNEDHSNMVKFADNDQNYQTIFPFVFDLVSGMEESISEPDLGRNLVPDTSQEMEGQLRKSILESLDNSERRWRYRHTGEAHAGTFDWVFGQQTGFVDWLRDETDQPNPIFWIRGKPGSGKSTLMKWIARNDKTTSHLNSVGHGPWEIIPFFFFEQGSTVQNTVEGLLQEILWNLLRMNRRLVETVLPVRAADMLGEGRAVLERLKSNLNRDLSEQARMWYSENFDRLHSAWSNHADQNSAGNHFLKSTWQPYGDWTCDTLEASILAILNQSEVNANVCLFIDGLDEYQGRHRRLTEVLRGLVDIRVRRCIRLKLCLASRPEPHFVHFFRAHPRILIHEYTYDDVQKFTSDRLMLCVSDTALHREEIRQLSKEISQTAEGVFIWASLVVDELCECLEEGSTILEVTRILHTVPKDLSDLYLRIFLRIKQAYRYEAFIMFQIVSCVIEGHGEWSLGFFKAVVDFVLTGTCHLSSVTDLQVIEFSNRLQSRTGGLLQVTVIENSTIASKISFLHRTVKPFLESPRVKAVYPKDLTISDYGPIYLLKFYVFALRHLKLEELDRYIYDLDKLPHYYDAAESKIGKAADQIYDDLLGPAAASEDLKALLIRHASNVPINTPTSMLRMEDRVLEYFHETFLPVDIAELSKAKLDGLHMSEVVLESTSTELFDRKFALHSASGPYRLLLAAANEGMMPYIKRKALSGHQMTMEGHPPVLLTILSFFRSNLLNYSLDVPKWLQEEDLDKKISELKDCLQEIARNQPNLAIHEQHHKSALKVFTYGRLPVERREEKYAIRFVREICELLIYLGFRYNDVLDNYPVWRGAERMMLLKLFLERGIHPDCEIEDGFRPLFFAISKGNIDEVRLLLDYGANALDVGHNISALRPELLHKVSYTYGLGLPADLEIDFENHAREMRGLLLKYTS